jgi:GNAT superfamily N-acetyltransferase
VDTKTIIVDGFTFSTDKTKLDVLYIHKFLSDKSYWARAVPIDIVRQSINNSMAIGIYHEDRQVGFARVVSDFATFAYLADVFVDEAYRGRGLSKRLIEFIFSFEDLTRLRRFLLATADAHSLYAQYGFKPLKSPERFMEIHKPYIQHG